MKITKNYHKKKKHNKTKTKTKKSGNTKTKNKTNIKLPKFRINKTKIIGGNLFSSDRDRDNKSYTIDTSRPLNKYFIFSSHNTEIESSQIFGKHSKTFISCGHIKSQEHSKISIDLYKKNKYHPTGGCLEIDINDLSDNAVGHFSYSNSTVSLTNYILDIYLNYAFQKRVSSDVTVKKQPLIINFDTTALNITSKAKNSVKSFFMGKTYENHKAIHDFLITEINKAKEMLIGHKSYNHVDDIFYTDVIQQDNMPTLNKITNKILFRWDKNYNYENNNNARDSLCINIPKQDEIESSKTKRKSISKSFTSKDKLERIFKFKKSNNNNLLRVYPNSGSINYDWVSYILLGINMIALNIHHIDYFNISYQIFFKYSHYLPIPNIIDEEINDTDLDAFDFKKYKSNLLKRLLENENNYKIKLTCHNINEDGQIVKYNSSQSTLNVSNYFFDNKYYFGGSDNMLFNFYKIKLNNKGVDYVGFFSLNNKKKSIMIPLYHINKSSKSFSFSSDKNKYISVDSDSKCNITNIKNIEILCDISYA